MRILGLDLGERRIGVALSNPEGQVAQPLAQFEPKGRQGLVAEVQRLVRQHGVERVVVGLPIRLDGTPGAEAQQAERTVAVLREAIGVPVTMWDERFSTRRAERAMRQANLSAGRRKGRRDKVAAALMLQSYLDAGAPPEGSRQD